MSKDLTNSSLDRKNILNNNLAIQEVYEQVGFYGIKFEGKYRFTKQQVAHYFEVDIRTIDRLLENHKVELEQSDYELYTGQKLKSYKEQVVDFVRLAREKQDVHDMNVVNILQLTENELDSLGKTSIVHNLDLLRIETKKLEAIYQKKLNDLDELKKSVLQKAFSGELKTKKLQAV